MKSDVETLFKTTRPSLIQMIGREPAETKIAPSRKIGASRYLAAAGIILVLLGGAAFLFLITGRPALAPPAKPVPPPALFAAETSRTITVNAQNRSEFLRLMEDSIREEERLGTVKRIIIKLRDNGGEQFAQTADFFNFYRIQLSQELLENLDRGLMTFVYYGESGARFGAALRSRDPDRTLRALLLWEPSLLRDFQPLFFDEKPDFVVAPFEDRTYRNIDWRFLKLSPTKDLGIAHAIFPAKNILVITTGKEALETVINRLFDAR